MKVLKFGGTSVGSPERMGQVMDIITRDTDTKIVVLSAVSGTTNSLVQINEALFKKDKLGAKNLIEALYDKYVVFVDGLYATDERKNVGTEIIDKQFEVIRATLDADFTDVEERLMLAQGELISTQLFQNFLAEKGITARLLWSLDFMCINEDDEPDMPSISKNLHTIVEASQSDIYIAQGYICMNHLNEVDNLKRGGSDYTASLIGAAIDATEVQIWTDIDGMHNNDPRIVDKTRPIAQLSFDEAAELAYFGAKILHPATIRPAQIKSIPVKLLNTMAPEAHGTVISNETGPEQVKAVAAKDNITAIKIKSSRMLLAYGFLRKIFEIFEKYKTPVDMITTSEIAVSLTIDDDTHLKDIKIELEKIAVVEVDTEMAIVCVVGSFAERKGIVRKVIDSMDGITIRMISYGGSNQNISLLVKGEDKIPSLQAINKHVFEL